MNVNAQSQPIIQPLPPVWVHLQRPKDNTAVCLNGTGMPLEEIQNLRVGSAEALAVLLFERPSPTQGKMSEKCANALDSLEKWRDERMAEAGERGGGSTAAEHAFLKEALHLFALWMLIPDLGSKNKAKAKALRKKYNRADAAYLTGLMLGHDRTSSRKFSDLCIRYNILI